MRSATQSLCRHSRKEDNDPEDTTLDGLRIGVAVGFAALHRGPLAIPDRPDPVAYILNGQIFVPPLRRLVQTDGPL